MVFAPASTVLLEAEGLEKRSEKAGSLGHLYLRHPGLYFNYKNVAAIWRAERLRSARRDWKDGGDVLDSLDAGCL